MNPPTEVSPRVRTRCPVCGTSPRVLHGTVCHDARLCPRCNHTFVHTLPTPNDLASLYESYGYDTDTMDQLPAFLDAILDDLVATLEPYRKLNRMLDVGFGAGGLLRAAKRHGWEAHGVEFSRAAVDRARAMGSDHIQLGDFREVTLEEGSYDAVVMMELVEHLPDPLPYFARAARVLRPGGVFYLTTPHGRGLSGRLLGASWSVLRPPEHLQLFSRRSIARMARSAGFQNVNVFTQGLLPHELLAKLRPRGAASGVEVRDVNAVAPTEGLPDRTTSGYALNEKLTTRSMGRVLKRAANLILRTTTLGDSLRLYAVR